jgi:mono/diheme cytochrome c family protein
MRRWRSKLGYVVLLLAIVPVMALMGARAATHAPGRSTVWPGATAADTIAHGRYLVLTHACGDCHGGGSDPSANGWLVGLTTPEQEFLIGPCAVTPGAKPCFHTRPRNLTPDNETGLGRFSERQIFNALRYGLRPEETPDVEIASTTPGAGNFPLHPRYLAPPMPWPSWRHMPDEDLWAIAAYLKRALKPVHNRVQESEGPPDFWASGYTVEKIGPHPATPFPTKNEQASTGTPGAPNEE